MKIGEHGLGDHIRLLAPLFAFIAAIAFTALTNVQNVYSAPEYSFGGGYLRHILGHLIGGVVFGTLVGSAMGSLLLWMLRRFTPKEARS